MKLRFHSGKATVKLRAGQNGNGKKAGGRTFLVTNGESRAMIFFGGRGVGILAFLVLSAAFSSHSKCDDFKMMVNQSSQETTDDELVGEHDDEDCVSSLGDASPRNSAEQRQKHRQKRTIFRLIFFFGAAICSLIFSIFNNKLSMYSQHAPNDLFAVGQDKASMAEMQELHIQHVASGMAHVFRPVSPSVWCIDARLKYEQAKRRPMGLCYLKIPRAASSTLSGMNQV
jgi:hypothetical protein